MDPHMRRQQPASSPGNLYFRNTSSYRVKHRQHDRSQDPLVILHLPAIDRPVAVRSARLLPLTRRPRRPRTLLFIFRLSSGTRIPPRFLQPQRRQLGPLAVERVPRVRLRIAFRHRRRW